MTPRTPQPLPRLTTSALLLLALLPPAAAQQPSRGTPADRAARAVSDHVVRAHLEFLADDALEGRRPGTRGGELAAKYVAAQFRRLGLEPAGDSGTYFHRVPIITLTPSPTLRASGRGGAGRRPAPLAYRDDYVLWSMRNDSLVEFESPVVFAGYGIVAPELGWDDYAGADVKGKTVVVLVNDPGLRDPAIFRGPILTYYGRWTYKIEEAARQGAAAILMVHTDTSATYPWTTVRSSWTGPQVRLEREPTSLLAAGWLQQDAAARLLRLGGADLAELSERAWRRGFRAVPLDLRVSATVRSAIERSETDNVIGRLPGRGPLAREVVLVGGHYDHFGIGAAVAGDSIYNGAEDNASGTAAVLTAAEALVRSGARPARSLAFIAFAAEESGLLGSEAFVERPPIPLRDVAAVLNLDVMNLYGPARDVSALGLDQSALGPVFEAAARAEGLDVTVNEDALVRGSFYRSDHFPLAKAGVPGLSLEHGQQFVGRPAGYGAAKEAEYIAKRYHQPSDEVQPWFDYAGVVQQLRVVVRTALAVADAPAQPEWRRTSEFRAAGEARRRG